MVIDLGTMTRRMNAAEHRALLLLLLPCAPQVYLPTTELEVSLLRAVSLRRPYWKDCRLKFHAVRSSYGMLYACCAWRISCIKMIAGHRIYACCPTRPAYC